LPKINVIYCNIIGCNSEWIWTRYCLLLCKVEYLMSIGITDKEVIVILIKELYKLPDNSLGLDNVINRVDSANNNNAIVNSRFTCLI